MNIPTFVMALVFAAALSAGAQQPPPPRGLAAGPAGEIVALMQRATGDWNDGNLDAFVAPYDERSTFMTRGGPIGKAEMRARYEKNYFAGGKPKQQLTYERLEVVPLGPDASLMTGRFVLNGGGQPEQSGWFTLVWLRTPGGWKILHDHTS